VTANGGFLTGHVWLKAGSYRDKKRRRGADACGD
jgi:hypothetical protein